MSSGSLGTGAGFPQIRRLVLYGGRTKPLDLKRVSVMQHEFRHDVMAAVVEFTDDDQESFKTGTPVEVTWGRSTRQETVYGYLHHPETLGSRTEAGRQYQAVKLVCIGTTFPMNEPRQRIWHQRSIPSIVVEVLDSMKLSGRVQPDHRVWGTLAQSGISDWEFIVGLAQKLGWSLTVQNTEISFGPPLEQFHDLAVTAPLFTAKNSRFAPDGGLLEFHIISGETTPDGGVKAVRRMTGVDLRTGDEFYLQSQGLAGYQLGTRASTPVFSRFETISTESLSEANATLQGLTGKNRWYIQATAEVQGRANLRPGQFVALHGIGQKHSGYWYLQGVEHELHGASYTAHLSLGRNAEWDFRRRPAPSHRRPIRLRPTPHGGAVAETPASLLVNGRWRAAYSPRLFDAG